MTLWHKNVKLKNQFTASIIVKVCSHIIRHHLHVTFKVGKQHWPEWCKLLVHALSTHYIRSLSLTNDLSHKHVTLHPPMTIMKTYFFGNCPLFIRVLTATWPNCWCFPLYTVPYPPLPIGSSSSSISPWLTIGIVTSDMFQFKSPG